MTARSKTMAPMDSNQKFDVLILEDDLELAEMLQAQLQTVYTKCRATIASDADEVVNEVGKVAGQGKHFYLIITDYTVLKRIKQKVSVEQSLVGMLQVSNPKPPVFLMSSADLKTIIKEHPDLEQHVDAYLKKPADTNAFLSTVGRLLNQYCDRRDKKGGKFDG